MHGMMPSKEMGALNVRKNTNVCEETDMMKGITIQLYCHIAVQHISLVMRQKCLRWFCFECHVPRQLLYEDRVFGLSFVAA